MKKLLKLSALPPQRLSTSSRTGELVLGGQKWDSRSVSGTRLKLNHSALARLALSQSSEQERPAG